MLNSDRISTTKKDESDRAVAAMTGYWGYRPLEDFTKVHRESLIELRTYATVICDRM
ncbi:hypothetical protein [Aerosakkonema funiforme]